MRITPVLMREIDSKITDPQIRILLFKIIEESHPNIEYTEYDQLHQMDDSYDTGFHEGKINMANNLMKFVELVLK